MKEINVSVIIPVYNVEEYIEQCVNSLINQDIRKVEFIFVNDGSTDKSIMNLKKYNDCRIKIIN